MGLNIPPEIERAILDRVQSGRYASAEDVLRACLEALEEQEEREAEDAEELRREIQLGMDDFERGDSLSREEVLARLREMRPGVRV